MGQLVSAEEPESKSPPNGKLKQWSDEKELAVIAKTLKVRLAELRQWTGLHSDVLLIIREYTRVRAWKIPDPYRKDFPPSAGVEITVYNVAQACSYASSTCFFTVECLRRAYELACTTRSQLDNFAATITDATASRRRWR